MLDTLPRLDRATPADPIAWLPGNGADASRLVIGFGGVFHGLNGPPLEFARWSSTTGWTWLFVRDLRQRWYTAGVSDDIDSPAASVAALREAVDEIAPSEVVAVGTSAGGWAALWFGALLGVDRVVALAPQTTIVRLALHALPDGRFHAALSPVWESGVALPDLRDLLPAHPGPAYHVHACGNDSADARHAERMRDVDGVTVYLHPCAQHNVAWWLRDAGLLGDAVEGRL